MTRSRAWQCLAFAVPVFVLPACGPAGAPTRADSFPVTRLESGPLPLVEPLSVSVNRRDWVVVADRSPARVLVVDDKGHLRHTVGRDGAGPGEFRSPVAVMTESLIVVFDPDLRRLTAFDTTTRVLWSNAAPCCRQSGLVADAGGTVWVPSSFAGAGWDALVAYGPSGRIRDTVIVPGSVPDPSYYWTLRDPGETAARFSTRIPLKPANHYAMSPAGLLWYGFSATDVVARGRSARDTGFSIRGHWPVRSVPDSLRAAVVDRLIAGLARFARLLPVGSLRQLAKPGEVPGTLPHFFGLVADACRRLWVLRTPFDLDLPMEWEVFSEEGRLLGRATLPVPTSAATGWSVGRSVLALTVTDSAGEPQLQRWRVPVAGCDSPSPT